MAQITVEAKYIADTAQYVKALRQAAAATNDLADSIPETIGPAQQLADGSRDMAVAAQEAGKGFTILRNAMGTAIGVAAVNMIGKIAGGIKEFARASFDAAARVEELDIAMKAIGESTGLGAESIMEATQAIRDNGIELGAAQQIAIEFAQNQLDMAAASKVARVAQDLAVVAGQNSTATTMTLTQAIITGNSMLLKSAGISRYAGEAYRDYAESLGKTTKQLTAQERQTAVTNMIIEEGAKVAGTYEASMDSAGKVLRSFKRIINDIQVEVGKVLLTAFGPLIKSTYDLVSAFSKSLREGGVLADVLAKMTEQFQQFTVPVVKAIKNLTEMVKHGVELREMGIVIQQIIPIFLALFSVVQAGSQVFGSVLAPAMRALMSVMQSVAPLVERLARFIESLPGPIKAAVGALILIQLVLKRLGVSLAVTNAAMVGFAVRTAASFRAASVSVLSFRSAAVASFAAVKTAARGLFAAIGPLGWTILALGAAFEIFSGMSADAQSKTDELKATLDETTRAMTDLTTTTIKRQMADLLSAQDIATLGKYGITLDEMADALVNGGDAVERVGQKFNDAIWPISRFIHTADQKVLATAERNFGGMIPIVADVADEYEKFGKEVERTNEAVRFSNQQMAHEAANSFQAMSAQQQIAAEVAARVGASFQTQAERHETAMGRMKEATEGAMDAMKTAFSGLDRTLSRWKAADRVRDTLAAMNEQLGKNTAGIDKFDGAARKNRDSVIAFVDSVQAMAKSFTDPRDQLMILEQGLAEVEKRLVGQEIDPKKSKLYRDLAGSVEEAKKEVGKMDDAVDDAEATGVTATAALVAGIIKGIEDNKGAADVALEAMAEGMNEKFMDKLGIQSPSTVMMKHAGALTAGLVQGLNAEAPAARNAAKVVAQYVIQGFITGIKTGSNGVNSAMRNMIKRGLDAARDEADIASDSKEGIRIGRFVSSGFATGIRSGSKDVNGAAEFMTNGLFSPPPNTGAAKKAGETIAAAFGAGFAAFDFRAGAGTAMEQLQAAFGSLPSLPTPLETMLGKKGASKYLEKHEKELIIVQRVFSDMDRISALVMSGADSLQSIHSRMTGVQGLYKGEPIQAPSELLKSIGPSGDLSSAIGAMTEMSKDVEQAFNVLLQTVDKGQRKTIRAQKNAVAGFMGAMQQEIFGLMIRRDQIRSELQKIDNTYSKSTEAINKHYGALEKAAGRHVKSTTEHFDGLIKAAQVGIRNLQRHYAGLEKSARANIDQIRKRYDALIPQLQDQLKSTTDAFDAENRVLQGLIQERDRFTDQIRSGFKSFVNSLSFETKAATKAIMRETKTLANGIVVTLEREIEVGGGRENIANALQERLSAVRDFSANIRTLMQRGVDPSLVQGFVSAGVSGAGDVVRELAAVSADEIAQINSVQQQLAREIADFQEYGVQQFHAAAIAQQEAIVAPLATAREQAEAALLLAEELRQRDLEQAEAHLAAILAMRDQELEAAQAHLEVLQEQKDHEVAIAQAALQNLRDDRDAALDAERVAYEAQRKVLEAEALLIDGELQTRAEAVRDYFTKLMAGPNGLPVLMRKAGANTMRGLLAGLNKIAPQVMARARAIAAAIRDEIQAALDMRSPSRVMEKLGIQIGLGLVEGMDASERSVRAAALDLANQVLVPVPLPNLLPGGAPESMGRGFGGPMSAGTTINITVNAPPLTDPAEVGRQAVEAIRKYERRSGPVFASAR